MKLLDFVKTFSDESSCEAYLRKEREKHGLKCPKCGCEKLYWDKWHKRWVCKQCRHEITLKSGTVMHGSKLPIMYWFTALHLLTSMKNSISTLEIQRQLSHKRYQPIWEMVHKIRSIMGIRDEQYQLSHSVEIDEAFFTTDNEEVQSTKELGEELKRGVGSQRKVKVLVMIESEKSTNPKPNQKEKKCGHLRMEILKDLKAETIKEVVAKDINPESTGVMDASKSHNKVEDVLKEVQKEVVKPKEAPKLLPWVHIAISNAKSRIENLYHGIKSEFLQYYLDEFVYKFNRRFFEDKLFDRVIVATISYRANFKHRLYNKNLSGNCG